MTYSNNVLYAMESPNYCRVKYSFDGNIYTELVAYQGGSNTAPGNLL